MDASLWTSSSVSNQSVYWAQFLASWTLVSVSLAYFGVRGWCVLWRDGYCDRRGECFYCASESKLTHCNNARYCCIYCGIGVAFDSFYIKLPVFTVAGDTWRRRGARWLLPSLVSGSAALLYCLALFSFSRRHIAKNVVFRVRSLQNSIAQKNAKNSCVWNYNAMTAWSNLRAYLVSIYEQAQFV